MSRGKFSFLKLQRLDDRIAPSVSLANPIFVNQAYWTQSEFIPVAMKAAEEGGAWFVGNTHRKWRYSEWGSWDNDWAITKLAADNRPDETFNGGQPFLELNGGPLRGFRILGLETGPDGTLYVLGRNSNQYLPFLDVRGFTPLTIPGDFDEPIVSRAVTGPTEEFAVARFNRDGSFDATFDGDGVRFFELDPQWDQPLEWDTSDAKIAIGADGSVVVAASHRVLPGETATGYVINAVRFTSAGLPDTTFDGDGLLTVTPPISQIDATYTGKLAGVAIASDGKVVFGGTVNVTDLDANETTDLSFTTLFAMRREQDGSPDSSFDGDSVSLIPSVHFGPSTVSASHFVLDGDNRPLLTGVVNHILQGDANPPVWMLSSGFVVRFDQAGAMDATFDDDGILYPRVSENRKVVYGEEIVPREDGGFVFMGREMLIDQNGFDNFVIAGYLADGSVDPAFLPHRNRAAEDGITNRIDVLTDGRILYLVQEIRQVFTFRSDSIASLTFNIPYNLFGPWQPPPGWLPFGRTGGAQWNNGIPFRATGGDFNGDGTDDFAYAIGANYVTNIRIVNGADGSILLNSFQPYESQFRGGLYVDAGDFDGDGKDELVVSPDEGGSARVQIFSFVNGTLIQKANYFAIKDTNFRGGGSIAVADMNGDGKPDLAVGAARGGSQRIATFDGKTLLIKSSFPPVLHRDYFAPLPATDFRTYRSGVDLRSEDTNGDGRDEIVMFANARYGNVGIVIYGVSGNLLRYDSLNFSVPSDRDEWYFNLITGKSTPI